MHTCSKSGMAVNLTFVNSVSLVPGCVSNGLGPVELSWISILSLVFSLVTLLLILTFVTLMCTQGSSRLETSHHAVFDECWFHQPWRPPAAQLLYELGNAVVNDLPDPPPVEPSTLPPSPTITSSEPQLPSTLHTPSWREYQLLPIPITQPDDDDCVSRNYFIIDVIMCYATS